MRWELLLYSGGTRLKGVKTTTEIKAMENGKAVSFPETIRDSLWVRLSQ
jgi:hypothetical protein